MQNVVTLSAHMRMVEQPSLWKPKLWVPGNPNDPTAPRNRTLRFLDGIFREFLGVRLCDNAGMERLEYLIRHGLGANMTEDQERAYFEHGIIPIRGAAEMADYLEQEVMEHVFKNTAIFAPVANTYVGLNTDDPTDADSGTEVTGGNYGRITIAAANWAAPGATGGSTNNSNQEDFATASGSWGTVSHAKCMDAVTVGNMYFHTPVDTPKAITTDDIARFNATDLTITLA